MLVTGQDYTPANVIACRANGMANCPTGLKVVAVDPKRTYRTDALRRRPRDPALFR